MPQLLITGGSGYLGAELVSRSLASGWTVAATYHTAPPPQPAPERAVQWHHLDLRDAEATERLVAELTPDALIHTAYRQSGPDLEAVTAAGAAAVARGARAAAARLIHMSSDVVFDGEREGSYTERDAPAPISEYGAAKAAAEQLVAAAYPPALIVRTSLIYGGPTPSKHEELALDAAAGRADIAFFTDEIRCPVALGDLAAALLELLGHGLSGPLHVAGADALSRYEFACLIAAAHGLDPSRLRAAQSAGSGLRRPRNCALDSGAARALLRTRLRGAREVLAPSAS